VLVAVRDAGVGIAPKDQRRIFDAFFTTKPQGMGMGLNISHSIVEGHGGRLWAEANRDFGTTFQFTIPASPDTVV
jgi:signal transduction histidine kinase